MKGGARQVESTSPPAAGYEVLACRDCGALDPGGRRYCTQCGADALIPMQVSGRGTLVSWTLVRRPPEGIEADGPYAVALVDLEEGVRITARVSNTEMDSAETKLVLGSPVEIVGLAGDVPIVALLQAKVDEPEVNEG